MRRSSEEAAKVKDLMVYGVYDVYAPFSFGDAPMIAKSGSGYMVKSHKGKKLSKRYASKSQALKRLREIEYFARKKG